MRMNNDIPESELHLGQLLKAELKKQGRTAVWLAKQVNCTPENIYKAFRSQWITPSLLFRISKAINHDFFHDCSEYLKGKGREMAGVWLNRIVPSNICHCLPQND